MKLMKAIADVVMYLVGFSIGYFVDHNVNWLFESEYMKNQSDAIRAVVIGIPQIILISLLLDVAKTKTNPENIAFFSIGMLSAQSFVIRKFNLEGFTIL